MTRQIAVGRGKFSVVDDSDYAYLSSMRWHYNHRGYVMSRINGIKVYMHRVVVAAPPGMCVDHINRDTFDNRRGNLRIVTQGQNLLNRVKRSRPATSKYKGVYHRSDYDAWVSRVGRRTVGTFKTEIDAALAYDRVAAIEYGEYARLNFPNGG